LIDDEALVAIVLSFDSRTQKALIEAYTPIPSDSDSPSVLSRVYLSACDFSVVSSHFYASHNSTSLSAQSRNPTSVPSPIPPKSTFSLAPFESVFAAEKKKYKPVAQKIRPIAAELPERFRIQRKIIGDPLADIPKLDPNPPPFRPKGRYTQERRDALDKIHSSNFLWPRERDLLHDFMCKQEKGFAWTDLERGRFRSDFFPPIEFPVVPHTPWVLRNIPIPPGIYDEVCRVIKKKLKAGVYERSNSSYRS